MLLQLTSAVVLTAHILAASAWFGAMFYSLAVLHPRARAFFASSPRFEEFVTFTAAGARWKVLSGCLFIAASGLLLLGFPHDSTSTWRSCTLAKCVLFTIAVALFIHTSCVVWPARLLASPAQAPAFQRRFRWIAIALLSLVGACFLLSVLAHHELPSAPATDVHR